MSDAEPIPDTWDMKIPRLLELLRKCRILKAVMKPGAILLELKATRLCLIPRSCRVPVVLLTALAVGCRNAPNPSSFRTTPLAKGVVQFAATTNLAEKVYVSATVYDKQGKVLERYVPIIEKGVLRLYMQLPEGEYVVLFECSHYIPIKTTIRTGIPITSQSLSFKFGDIDRDGKVTSADLALLKRQIGRRRTAKVPDWIPLGIARDLPDPNGDGQFTEQEYRLAQTNAS